MAKRGGGEAGWRGVGGREALLWRRKERER